MVATDGAAAELVAPVSAAVRALVVAGTRAELTAGSGPVLRFRLAGDDGAGVAIDASELGALGAALNGTLAPDGAPEPHRLAGRAPDPRAIACLADRCEQRGLLPAELQTSGGTLDERFLEPISEARPSDETHRATQGKGAAEAGRRARVPPRPSRPRVPPRPSRHGHRMSRPATPDVLRSGDGRPSSPVARAPNEPPSDTRRTSERRRPAILAGGADGVRLRDGCASPAATSRTSSWRSCCRWSCSSSSGPCPSFRPLRPRRRGARPIDAVLPAILATAIVAILATAIVAAGLVNLGISTGFERSCGIPKRLGGSPLTRGQPFFAKIGTNVVIEAAQAVLLIGHVVAVFGQHPGPGWDPLAVVVTVAPGTGAFSALGLLPAGDAPGGGHDGAGLARPVRGAGLFAQIGPGTSTRDAVGPLLLLGASATCATTLTARDVPLGVARGRAVAGRPGVAGRGTVAAATGPRSSGVCTGGLVRGPGGAEASVPDHVPLAATSPERGRRPATPLTSTTTQRERPPRPAAPRQESPGACRGGCRPRRAGPLLGPAVPARCTPGGHASSRRGSLAGCRGRATREPGPGHRGAGRKTGQVTAWGAYDNSGGTNARLVPVWKDLPGRRRERRVASAVRRRHRPRGASRANCPGLRRGGVIASALAAAITPSRSSAGSVSVSQGSPSRHSTYPGPASAE